MGRKARSDPGALLRGLGASLPEVDRKALDRADRRATMVRAIVESTSQGGDSCAHEHALATRKWGFSLTDIAVPVAIFQGAADEAVPLAMGRAYAQASARVDLRIYEGEGHISIVPRAGADLMRYLAAS